MSLSSLRKFDHLPFIVCLITPTRNYCLIANSTFLKKVSHSSQELRENNICGSFNGSDIVKEFDGVENCGLNIERLFRIHEAVGFEENLTRLVEATNAISPSGAKFLVGEEAYDTILSSPDRAAHFVSSEDSIALKDELDSRVAQFRNEILLAALIDNVNIRGRVIEYLIAGEDEYLRQHLISALHRDTRKLPELRTPNALGDYLRSFELFDAATDVKTKIMTLNSNPKAYNLDKMLEFLADKRSVFMFYFAGVVPGARVQTALVSMYQTDILEATILLRHWAGRNSRGVSQLDGRVVKGIIERPETNIDLPKATDFVRKLIEL